MADDIEDMTSRFGALRDRALEHPGLWDDEMAGRISMLSIRMMMLMGELVKPPADTINPNVKVTADKDTLNRAQPTDERLGVGIEITSPCDRAIGYTEKCRDCGKPATIATLSRRDNGRVALCKECYQRRGNDCR